MQIVYISNRPSQLLETLSQVALHMPFVREAVVCGPEHIQKQLSCAALSIEFISEESLLGERSAAKLAELDHQSRNYLLRQELVKSNVIAEEFIMADDDARPLRALTLAHFKQDGKYRNYYFHDLAHWHHNRTEFDSGQISTWAVLLHKKLPTLAYASHMPQLINREIFRAATEFFANYREHHALCEWSTYFNFARHHAPERFAVPEAYVTLCWPEHPLAWRSSVKPRQYLFENFTASLYHSGGVFAGLPALSDGDMITVEKIVRWKNYSISLQHPEQTRGFSKYFKMRTWTNKFWSSM